MVWSAIPFCMFLLLLHPPTTHLVGIFTNYIHSLPAKTSNCAKYKITVFSILRHIRPRSMPRWPLVVNQDGGILTYFDDPWKIEDLTKSKIFCGKVLQKRSCVILGARCTLKEVKLFPSALRLVFNCFTVHAKTQSRLIQFLRFEERSFRDVFKFLRRSVSAGLSQFQDWTKYCLISISCLAGWSTFSDYLPVIFDRIVCFGVFSRAKRTLCVADHNKMWISLAFNPGHICAPEYK